MSTSFSTIRHPLKAAVAAQMGGVACLYEQAEDISRYGISGGYGGFVYYNETNDFVRRHRSKILACLKEDAEACGVSMLKFLSGFKCLKGWSQDEIAEGLYHSRADSRQQVYNALAWYAAESVCHALVNG